MTTKEKAQKPKGEDNQQQDNEGPDCRDTEHSTKLEGTHLLVENTDTIGNDRAEDKPSDSSRIVKDNPSQADSLSVIPKSNAQSFDHILKTSLDLDEVAKRGIDRLMALGSRRLAPEYVDLLQSISRAVDQNANLLRILRDQLGTHKDD